MCKNLAGDGSCDDQIALELTKSNIPIVKLENRHRGRFHIRLLENSEGLRFFADTIRRYSLRGS